MGVLLYGHMMLGAKGITYWVCCGYYATSEWGVNSPQIRLGLGGFPYPAPYNRLYGYYFPNSILQPIHSLWDYIGTVNAEWQVLGDWLARSDVTYRGRIISSAPALAPIGKAAAECSALVSGLDTVIFIVLNLNIVSDWSPFTSNGFVSYDPVTVTAGVTVPSWMQGKINSVYSVDSATGISDVTYTTVNDELQFTFTDLADCKIVVITSNPDVRADMTAAMASMQARLAEM